MFNTVDAPIEMYRNAPFQGFFYVVGIDLEGADARFEVRDRKDGGELRVGIDDAPSGDGVRISSATVGGVATTTIEVFLTEATVESLPLAPEVGDDLTLFYGLHLTPSGGIKFLAFQSEFVVKGTVPA